LLAFARSLFAPRRVPQYSPSGTTRIWRLAYVQYDPAAGKWGSVRALRTGLPGNEVECSPCVSIHDGQFDVSFIGTANHGIGRLEHRLFRMSGHSLEHLTRAVPVSRDECFSGFWRPDLSALATGHDGEIRLSGSINARLDTGFQEIARISFMDDFPHRLLITGAVPGESGQFAGQPQPQTIIYDLLLNAVLGELHVAGAPAYKPSASGRFVAHVRPHPTSHRREAWQVALTEKISLVPTAMPVRQFK
jgi:hypothetical protein